MKIKLGDTIYIRQYSGLVAKITITKTTPTTAKSKNYTFDIEVSEGGSCRIKGQDKWASSVGYLETEELKKEWETKALRSWFEKQRFTDEQIKQIYNLIK